MKQVSGTILLSAILIQMAHSTAFSQQISDHVEVIQGAVNGALLRQNGKVLAIYGDPRERPAKVDTVLFTHHRRDVVWAGRKLVQQGAKAVVPAREKKLFTQVKQFWSDFEQARFHDYDQQTTKVLTEPIPVNQTVSGGETLTWEGIPIQVLDTAGYTRGAVSYLLNLDGKRIAFTGDLIYGDGRILDWYSLQDGVSKAADGGDLRGYHGYAARTHELIGSLRCIAAQHPDLIVPARGPVIHDVSGAASRLIERLQAAYTNYQSINALRWYFKDKHIRLMADRVLGPGAQINWMPFAKTIHDTPPDWIIPISNSRLVVAKDKSGFLIDCGYQSTIDKIKELIQKGQVRSIDGVYITHYHDDHTDQIPALVQEFGCPVYACREIQDILENPAAYRMPAMTNHPIYGLKIIPEGGVLKWKEFKMTSFYFPGQTLYHGSFLVEKNDGEKIFFIGDSFTPSGIDDYCLQNRNFLHPNMGYFYCLNFLQYMPPDYLLINQHVVPTFRFSADQLDFMQNTLKKRVDLLRDLFPWDDPNYGLDEGWARFYPYEEHGQPGETLLFSINIMNHSPRARTFHVRFRPPKSWKVGSIGESAIRSCEKGTIRVEVTSPVDTAPGLYFITADLLSEDMDFREWTEAMIRISVK